MRKTVHFYRKYTSCHIDLIVSHFYFILFVPKSQSLDNNYYVFNIFLIKLFVKFALYCLKPLTKDLIFYIIFLKAASTTKRLFNILR